MASPPVGMNLVFVNHGRPPDGIFEPETGTMAFECIKPLLLASGFMATVVAFATIAVSTESAVPTLIVFLVYVASGALDSFSSTLT